MATQTQYDYYECGICDHLHPWLWAGDCRDDANRLAEVPDAAWDAGRVATMTERVEADARSQQS